MMRRMSADNHRGQEAKIFHKQAGYMRAMIFSHINDQMSCKRSGSIYVPFTDPRMEWLFPFQGLQRSNRGLSGFPQGEAGDLNVN